MPLGPQRDIFMQDDGERNKRIVSELLKVPGNQFCADCGAKGEWLWCSEPAECGRRVLVKAAACGGCGQREFP
jgi:hypothetical protein